MPFSYIIKSPASSETFIMKLHEVSQGCRQLIYLEYCISHTIRGIIEQGDVVVITIWICSVYLISCKIDHLDSTLMATLCEMTSRNNSSISL